MTFEGLDKLVARGRNLLEEREPVYAHREFNHWINEVSAWINKKSPDSGLSADWFAQGDSILVIGGHYDDRPSAWAHFRQIVQVRVKWLADLPHKVQNLTKPRSPNETALSPYVNLGRINEIKSISNDKFDLRKLVRLCEELNICFAGDCYLSTMMLTRAILDHVPPIFGCSKFSEVANNYSGGTSFKQLMQRLEQSSRNISDQYLHSQIRKSETLPNITQINFSNELDVLLAEVTRILKG
jgi:hypothetical protein